MCDSLFSPFLDVQYYLSHTGIVASFPMRLLRDLIRADGSICTIIVDPSLIAVYFWVNKPHRTIRRQQTDASVPAVVYDLLMACWAYK